MSRVPPILPTAGFLILLLLLAVSMAIPAGGKPTASSSSSSCNPQSCAALDVAILQAYVSGLNVTDFELLPRVEGDGKNEDLVIESLPFGVLRSDWTRLLLLQKRQPVDALLRDNLLRLSRIMLAAYFDSQEYDLLNSTASLLGTSEDEEAVTILSISKPETNQKDQQAHNADSTEQKDSSATTTSFGQASITTTTNITGILDIGNQPGNKSLSSKDKKEKEEEDDSSSPLSSFNSNNDSTSSVWKPVVFFTHSTDNNNETRSGNASSSSNSDNAEGSVIGTTGSSGQKEPGVQLDEARTIATQSSNEKEEAEEGSSAANEAVHERSREKYLESQERAKATGGISSFLDASKDGEEEESADAIEARNHIKSVELFFASESTVEQSREVNRSTELESSSQGTTQTPFSSVNNSGNSNSSSSSKNNHNDNIDLDDDDDDDDNDNNGSSKEEEESISLEFNSTKSIEEFFASASSEKTTKLPPLLQFDIKDERKEEESSTEELLFSVTETSLVTVSGTESLVNITSDDGSSNATSSSEEAQITDSLEDFFADSGSKEGGSDGILTASVEAFFNTDNPLDAPSNYEEVAEVTRVNGNLSMDEAVTDTSTNRIEDDVKTTTELAGLSEVAPTLMISNEESIDSMMQDRSPEVLLIATTMTTTTMLESEHNKTLENNNSEESLEHQSNTTARSDDLFKEETDWNNSTKSLATIDPVSSLEVAVMPTHPLLRRRLMTFHHEPISNPAILESGKLREPTTSFQDTETADSWEGSPNDESLDSTRSLRNRRRSVGSAENSRMNKRKIRKRSPMFRLVERQYRSF